jgi:hypothetical protein
MKKIFLFMLLISMVSACAQLPTHSSSTENPAPTSTFTFTPTSTPQPTFTLTPTLTFTPIPTEANYANITTSQAQLKVSCATRSTPSAPKIHLTGIDQWIHTQTGISHGTGRDMERTLAIYLQQWSLIRSRLKFRAGKHHLMSRLSLLPNGKNICKNWLSMNKDMWTTLSITTWT